jgi:alpha-beta hydrolase superfamily lysophospholipase
MGCHNTGRDLKLALIVLLFSLGAAQAQTIAVPAIDAGRFSSPIVERDIQFPTDGLMAPGTLALPPHAVRKVPIVVMVQGSGVQDRDSTIGPNKIFQQIAMGLAEQGIATLRYDRRPKFALSSFLAHPDLDHEVVIDAAAALAYCETIPEIDPRQIYLLGHSLGAELAPDIVKRRLAQMPNSVHGMILMSGIARPIDVVMLEQIRTLGKAQGGTPEQIDPIVAAWTAVFAAAEDPKTPDSQPIGVGTKIPASYWRDWLHRDPTATMAKLHIPTLVLRGENDNNVTHEDFQELAKAATAPGSASVEFPGLNHEYQPGTGDGTELLKPAQVAAAPIDAIASWIKTGKIQ